MTNRKTIYLAILLIGSFALVACGAQEIEPEAEPTREVNILLDPVEEEATKEVVEVETKDESSEIMADGTMLEEVDPLTVSGDIVIAGSSTVFPLAERMIEVFENEGFGDLVTYDSIGSGGGFERFCEAGESDIAGASRDIKEGEIESCAAIGREPIEFRIGTDALAVVVSAENDFLVGATMEELGMIFSTAETWADVNPDYPAEPILRYIPGTDSGTFDFFVEEVFDEDTAPILAANNTELSEDDNVLVTGVVDSPYAIAFFGYAYYQENADVVNILSIDGVEANQENVDAAAYPLARPLIVYSDAGIMAEKPQVGQFLSFLMQNVNEEIVEVGYFPANDEVLGKAKSDLAKAINGETVMGSDTDSEESMAEEHTQGMLEEVDPLTVSGDIVIAGSSTVFPLAERMIEVFENEGFGDLVTYDSIGSGGGFERFCEAGESDIAGASRDIKEGEIEACAAIGREPIEFRIGTDALAVVVSAENDFLVGATMEELALIFSTAETWADVNPDYPAEPILRYIPGTDSGTFDFFVEEVFDEDTAPILAANNTELSEDDNVLVTGVVDSPYAIAFFGYAYYQENADVVNILAIDGVEANQENVDAAAYPLARPLIVYSDAGIIAEKPQVGQFLSFLMQNVNEEIIEVGYFPANDEVLNEAKSTLAAAIGQ
ncbi:MAG: substrate-binding domain-containing protein [Anaerolineae bacterium]